VPKGGDNVKPGKKSRREALGMIGKTGICIGAGPAFFVSLKIQPEQRAQKKSSSGVQEKAVIIGSGSKLTVKIFGKPGRHFFIAVAGSDVKENYRSLPNAKGIINQRGAGEIFVDIGNLLNARIFLKIVTSDTEKFDSISGATEAFIINAKDGTFLSFEGITDRPILGAKALSAASTPAAVVGRKALLK
jgi:hypothetical protein